MATKWNKTVIIINYNAQNYLLKTCNNKREVAKEKCNLSGIFTLRLGV